MARKAKTKKQAVRRASKIADEKHVGSEIKEWKSVDQLDRAIYQTLRHYAYYYDRKDYVKWAREWVKKTRNDKQYKAFCKAEDWRISPTIAGLCRMIWNGLELEKHRLKWLNARVDEVIEAGSKLREEAKAAPPVARKSPADLVKERTGEFIAEIEEVVDNMTTRKMTREEINTWSIFEEMKKNDVPYQTAKSVLDFYTPILAEWKELVENKPEDLVEAYSNVGVRQRNANLKFFQRLVDDCQLYMNSKKAVRKPRAKKEVPVSKIVSAVKYLPESKEYKVSSVAPEKLVGAETIVIFNTKYKRINVYVALKKEGMTVKGTTIQDFDPEKSFSKTIRKPAEYFKDTAKTTKARNIKMLRELKTKEGDVNGRINADCIIYKVY